MEKEPKEFKLTSPPGEEPRKPKKETGPRNSVGIKRLKDGEWEPIFCKPKDYEELKKKTQEQCERGEIDDYVPLDG